MDTTNNEYIGLPAEEARTIPTGGRCAICARRIGKGAAVVAERLDGGEPREWTLCASCHEAVRNEVERAALDTPLRVPVALGIVASERAPGRRPHIWEERFWQRLDSGDSDWLILGIVKLAFAAQAASLILTTAYVALTQ